MSEREQIAEELHEQYLAAARRLGWPLRSEVDVEYSALSDDAKELDRVFADWHLGKVAGLRERLAQAKRVIEAAEALYPAEGMRVSGVALVDRFKYEHLAAVLAAFRGGEEKE